MPQRVREAPAPVRTGPEALGGIPPWLRHAVRTALHLAADGTAVALAYRAAYHVRFRWEWWVARFPIAGEVPDWRLYDRLLYAVAPLWLMIFLYSSRLYTSPWLSSTDRFLRILQGSLLGTGGVMLATYVYQRLQYSRMMLLLVLPIAVVLVAASHALVLWLDRLLARWEKARPVLLVGGGVLAEEVKARILSRHPGAVVHQIAELPATERLAAFLRDSSAMEMILLKSSLPHDRILAAAEAADGAGVSFKMLPDLLELRFGEVQMDESLGLPAYLIRHTSLTRVNFLAKRVFDVVFSLLVLLACAVPFALIALLVRLDSPGPVLYRQRRYGYRGRVFDALKFRTMAADAEARLEAVKDGGERAGGFFKAKADPRVTRAGRWLRRFSLDEFPQFLNVLAGDMSVVGPRPLAVQTGELDQLEKEFGATARKRLNILPGITGLWQVSGRSDVSSAQRFALDLFYIEHWSLGLDLEIILKTLPAMLSGKGAY